MHASALQPGLWQNRSESIPLKQAATPEQAAAAILYFASSKSGNTTGASLAIAGGTNIPIEDRFITTHSELDGDKQSNTFLRANL